MAGSDGASSEDFAHLPSGKLLTDLVEWSRLELILKWDGYGAPDEFPVLGQLWAFARISARSRARDGERGRAAADFLQAADRLDGRCGDPRRRGWILQSSEADERFEVVSTYLYDSGLLSLREAEKGAPTEFLLKKELEGQ